MNKDCEYSKNEGLLLFYLIQNIFAKTKIIFSFEYKKFRNSIPFPY